METGDPGITEPLPEERSPDLDASLALALRIAETAREKKALDPKLLDVGELLDYTDFLFIATGSANRHVGALADHIEKTLASEGIKPFGVEGLPHANWVLMDFGGVVVHLFCEQVRHYYNLESIWFDAPGIDIPE